MTDSTNPAEAAPQTLFTQPRNKIRAAILCGLVLGVGAWCAPRRDDTVPPAPQERVAPLLEEQVRLREVPRPFTGVEDAAARVRPYTVAVLPPPETDRGTHADFAGSRSAPVPIAAFGAFVTDRHVLVDAAALDGDVTARLFLPRAGEVEGALVAYDATTGLALVEAPPSSGTPAPLADRPPAPGALAVGVGEWETGHVAIPVFVTSVTGERYTLDAGRESFDRGVPIFNLDGELLAVSVADGRGMRGHSARVAAGRLLARAATGAETSSFGVRVQALSGLLTRTFGAEGVIVTEVVPDGPADAAGLEPGDVLLAIGDTPIDSVTTAERVLRSRPPGVSTPVRIRRNGAARTVAVIPEPGHLTAARARTAAQTSGPEARAVLPRAMLDSGPIPESARVLRINGRSITSSTEARRALRLAPRATILLEHRGDTFFVVIEP